MSDKDRKDMERKKKKGTWGRPGGSAWSLVFWVFVFWLAFSYLFNSWGGADRVRIPYTEFKGQVEKGNVEKITSKGSRITGQFAEQYTRVDSAAGDTTAFMHFATVRPAFDDPELMALLEDHGITIEARAQEDSNWWYYLLIMLLPWVLIIGYFVYAGRKMRGKMGGMMGRGGGGLFGVGKSRAKKFRESDVDVGFDDVAGLDNAKQNLREIIEYLKEPARFTALGAEIPKGVLLMGPPGTGKTLLARAVSGEAEAPFYSISGSEFIEMFVGVGASRVRDMFENAKKEQPAIIFIDEIDSVGRSRGTGVGGGHDEREQTLNQILNEMDGFEPNESVVVIAATNRPDVLDPALTRPGRFDRQITLELPQREARHKILRIHSRDVPLADDVDLENIAARTVGFSGADLANLVNEAALLAGREDKKEVSMGEFEKARDKIILGAEREEVMEDEEKRQVAYHESGHALVAKLIEDTDPLQKVTIIPRGRALGATEQVPETDRHNYHRDYLLNRIAVMLGGRAAEKVVFDRLSNGAADDIKKVTELARKMVCQWGMSDKLGPVRFAMGEDHIFLGKELSEQKDFSDRTGRIIDEEIKRIVGEQEERALDLLRDNRDRLDRLADELHDRETLENEEIEQILGLGKGEKNSNDDGPDNGKSGRESSGGKQQREGEKSGKS